MKTNIKIEEDLIDNQNIFQDEFYKRFQLRHNKSPLQLTDQISKDYLFPTFYKNVTCAIGIFFCSYTRAEKLMPFPEMKPVSMGRGRSLVIFSCYEYKTVLGIPPYNEIAMTIPILINPFINIPVLPMISNFSNNFGYYCFSMPVTSLENQIRGIKIWGIPKVVQEIPISHKDEECHIQVIDEKGETYLDLKIPKTGDPTCFDSSVDLYSIKEGKTLQSKNHIKGNFNIIKHTHLLWGKKIKPNKTYLYLSHNKSAQVLQKLELEEHPFQFRYTDNMSCCFDLPDQN